MNGNLAPRKNLRFAFTLNLLLPGTGQLYLGQTILGAIYIVGFVSIFVTLLALFLRGYTQYIEWCANGDILEGDHLEKISRVFPSGWLIGLAVLAILCYVASLISLRMPKPATETKPDRF